MAASFPLAVLVKTFPKISETFILSEILGLERAGLDLGVIALQPPTDDIVQPRVAELKGPCVYLDAHYASASDEDIARELAWKLRLHRVRHLHAHFVDRPGRIAALAAKWAGITYSLSAHAKDIYLGDAQRLAPLMDQAQFTVTCTECNERHLGLLAAPHTSLQRVYHGIDSRRFTPAPRRNREYEQRLRLLAVGRLRGKKGFGTLIEACGLLRDRGYDFCADIVGYGEEQERLQQQIGQLGLGDHVTLRGKMNHPQLIELYQAADIFAAPCEVTQDGDRDGIPNVLLEAMAMRLAVVATEVSGIPEAVRHESNGLLIPERDPVALSAALARLMNDQPLRLRFGANARRTVIEHFSEERNCRALMDLLAPLLGAARNVQPALEPMYASA